MPCSEEPAAARLPLALPLLDMRGEAGEAGGVPRENDDASEAPEASDFLAALTEATPQRRTELLLDRAERDPQRRLTIPRPAADDARPMLDRVDLSGAGDRLRAADLSGASLRYAIFTGCDVGAATFAGAVLGSASFAGASAEQADFRDADMIAACFADARAGEANFAGAMLEDASFTRATLRFANFEGSVADDADFEGADLWGATLRNAEARDAVFRGARLDEASLAGAMLVGADLQAASLKKADLSGADLSGANLQGATLSGANLTGADLRDAHLAGVTLATCDLTNAFLSGAWLERTRFRREQLGGAIGEEITGDYERARLGYLALEPNFRSLGDSEGASWAYRKSRRMGKLHERRLATETAGTGNWRAAVRHAATYAGDVFVEWLCDYGESLTRVLRALLVTYLLFAAFYWATGSLVRPADTPDGASKQQPVYSLREVLTYTLLTMTETGPPDMLDVKPASTTVYFIGGIEGAVGIALVGLFGFVAGNRIRR